MIDSLGLIMYPLLVSQADQESMIIRQENEHVMIIFDENVDLNTSLFFVDGVQIELTSTLEWTMDKDTNEINVVLYDLDQNVLHIESFELTCDVSAPEIYVKNEGVDIDSQVYMQKNIDLDITCLDENEIEVLATLDDETIPITASQYGYSIECDRTGLLNIICTDAFGNVSEKIIEIKPFEFSWNNDMYILDNNWKPSAFSSVDDLEVALYKDDQLIYTWTQMTNDPEYVVLDQTGEYRVQARSVAYPYLSFEDDVFYYETGDVKFDLDASKAGVLLFDYDEKYFKAGQVKIYDGDKVKLLPLQKVIEYDYPLDTRINFGVEAVLIDWFGRTSTIFDLASFDHQAPMPTIFVNGVAMESGSTIHFEDRVDVMWSVDDAAFENVRYWLNGYPISFSSLEQAFQLMSYQDELYIEILFEDESMNQTISQLTFIKNKPVKEMSVVNDDQKKIEDVPIKKVEVKEVISTSIVSHEKAADQQVVRTWRVLEDDTLALVDQEVSQMNSNPISIDFYKADGSSLEDVKVNDRVRIVLQTKDKKAEFKSISINGKDIPLNSTIQDSMGMDMIEVNLEEDENEIVVKAVDEKGNVIIKTKKVNVQKELSGTMLVLIAAIVGAIIGTCVYFIRSRKHD